MFNVTRRVSFAVAIALTVGWGIFFLLFLASSSTLFEAQQYDGEHVVTLPPGVRLSVQVDKRVYRGGDAVLIAVRNDSRLPIWIPQAETCPSFWWGIEQLGSDGETWAKIGLSKQECDVTGIELFANHSLKTDAWMALVPGTQIGDVLVPPPTGTYRVSVNYVKKAKGAELTLEDWAANKQEIAASTPFTIQ